mmetsp:Transcript_26614/g.78330  ORF Transcript_26614/g.78330 Transcript_26614/m.78330 type:complete len:127 (-) Transcript_26614:4165-4545(-)
MAEDESHNDAIGIENSNIYLCLGCCCVNAGIFTDIKKCLGTTTSCQFLCCHCSQVCRMDFEKPIKCCIGVTQLCCLYESYTFPPGFGGRDVPIVCNLLGLTCYPKFGCCQTQEALIMARDTAVSSS